MLDYLRETIKKMLPWITNPYEEYLRRKRELKRDIAIPGPYHWSYKHFRPDIRLIPPVSIPPKIPSEEHFRMVLPLILKERGYLSGKGYIDPYQFLKLRARLRKEYYDYLMQEMTKQI